MNSTTSKCSQAKWRTKFILKDVPQTHSTLKALIPWINEGVGKPLNFNKGRDWYCEIGILKSHHCNWSVGESRSVKLSKSAVDLGPLKFFLKEVIISKSRASPLPPQAGVKLKALRNLRHIPLVKEFGLYEPISLGLVCEIVDGLSLAQRIG